MNSNANEETAAILAAPQAAEPSVDSSQPEQTDISRTADGKNGEAKLTPSETAETTNEEPLTTERSSAYSANTVAAISSLLNDESPLFNSTDENSSASTLETSNKEGKNYELTVSDRATAIMSVYRDYLYEGLEDRQNVQAAQESAATANQPLMVREGDGHLLLLDGDLNNIKIDRTGLPKEGEGSLQHGTQVLTPQDLRKEEIKLATLEKFCAEGGKDKKKSKNKKKKKPSSGESKSSASTSVSTLSKSTASRSANSKSTSKQTAASTTAAFRLKADVALRTVSSATNTVIQKATVASRTASKVIKTKYRDATVDVNHIQDEITNDYDFQNYDYDGNEGLAPPSTGLDDYMEDMEYGISPLGDKGLVFRSDGDEEEDEMSFKDICDDLGVTKATHPNLDRHNGKRKYKYPVFRSKKFRKALCYGAVVMLVGIVAVSIASAITNGFEQARRQKSPPLPDYKSDEEWREKQKEEWEEEHGEKYTGYNNVAVVVPDIANANNVEDAMPPPPVSKHDKLLQSISAAYRPIWFDRSTGWKGQTYQEALDFCGSYNQYIPCPYEVYCPQNKELLSGVMDHEGESWAAVINMQNEWVQVGTDKECELYTDKYGKEPEWGVNGQNNEMITRHIMCCRSHPESDESTWNPPNQPGSAGNDYVLKPVAPDVTTTEHVGAAIAAAGGPDGVKPETTEIPSTVLPSPNGSSGTAGKNHNDIASIEGLGSMTEWENQIQTAHHPAWFSNEFGWEGTTYSDGEAFCRSIPHGSSTLELCPLQAYCPNGPRNDKPLYLQMDAFSGEQWAPVKLESGNEWVMVGMLNKDPSSTCRTYNQLHHKQPSWGIDGSKVDIKKHILCCEGFRSESGGNALLGGDGLAVTDNVMDENSASSSLTDMVVGIQGNNDDNSIKDSSSSTAIVETVDWHPAGNDGGGSSNQGTAGSANSASQTAQADDQAADTILLTFDPIWLDSDFGWNGGSHSDAIELCNKIKGFGGKHMELCPYAAYCPHGPSHPPLSGAKGIEEEGEQWAPVYGQENHWVSLTPREGNLATSCLSYAELNDEMPSWGLDDSNKEMKHHIMCCVPQHSSNQGTNTDIIVESEWGGTNADSVVESEWEEDSANSESQTAQAAEDETADVIISSFDPIWLDSNFGWKGGSHSDALEFCHKMRNMRGMNMELCPYAAYCPHGPSHPPLSGPADVDEEGEQWAPVYGRENHWVLLTPREGNLATSCMSYIQLNGEMPSWGLDDSNKEMKHHIMCCAPLQ